MGLWTKGTRVRFQVMFVQPPRWSGCVRACMRAWTVSACVPVPYRNCTILRHFLLEFRIWICACTRTNEMQTCQHASAPASTHEQKCGNERQTRAHPGEQNSVLYCIYVYTVQHSSMYHIVQYSTRCTVRPVAQAGQCVCVNMGWDSVHNSIAPSTFFGHAAKVKHKDKDKVAAGTQKPFTQGESGGGMGIGVLANKATQCHSKKVSKK